MKPIQFNPALIAIPLLMMACDSTTQSSQTKSLEPIVVDYNSTTPINSLFEDITLIPLDSENGELLGETLYLFKDNDSYYVMDMSNKTLQRYSLDGKFRNSIGRQGRADNEYSNIVDCYIGSQVSVLSSGRKVNNYTKDGEFVGANNIDFDAMSVLQTSKYTYYNLGLGNAYSEATLAVVSNDGSEPERKLLPKKTSLSLVMTNAFCNIEDTVIFHPAFSSDLYQLTDTVPTVRHRFDFGKYTITDEIHNQKDIFKGFEMLQKNGFADFIYFKEVENSAVAVITVQESDNTVYLMLGALNKEKAANSWQWVKIESDNSLWINGGFCLDDESNYYVIVPAYTLLGDDVDLSLVKNKEVLEGLTEDSNSVIMKCKLK